MTTSAPSDMNLTTVGSYLVTLADGEAFLDADFGFAQTLPKTGIESQTLALCAAALLGAGALILVIAPRRRREESE